MHKSPRMLVVGLMLVTGLAYGIWPPPSRYWAPWLATWLGALALSLGMLWIYGKARRETDAERTPVIPIPDRAAWAHEVRTPLMHMALYLQQVRQTLPLEAEPAMDHLEMELARISQMMESMSLLNQATQDIHLEPLEIADWLTHSLPLYREAAETLGFTLTSDIQPAGTIMGSATALAQILSNLISNAFRYALPGSTIRVTLAPDGPFWMALGVANPSSVPQVEPILLTQAFVRGSTGRDGSGLGLSVVAHIADSMGGRIHCRYQSDTFQTEVVLPVVHAYRGTPPDSHVPD